MSVLHASEFFFSPPFLFAAHPFASSRLPTSRADAGQRRERRLKEREERREAGETEGRSTVGCRADLLLLSVREESVS